MGSETQHVNYSGAPLASPPQASLVPERSEVVVDVADQLRKLAELREAGVLTEEEFAAQKAKLLA